MTYYHDLRIPASIDFSIALKNIRNTYGERLGSIYGEVSIDRQLAEEKLYRRTAHLALCFLRGTPYELVESNTPLKEICPYNNLLISSVLGHLQNVKYKTREGNGGVISEVLSWIMTSNTSSSRRLVA